MTDEQVILVWLDWISLVSIIEDNETEIVAQDYAEMTELIGRIHKILKAALPAP